jgi:phage terminase large subunit-like protein
VNLADLPDVVGMLEDRDELEVYLQAELRRIREDPLTYKHSCHAMQEQWLTSRSRRRIVVAANRVGKTEGAMRDVLWTARGNHPYRKTRLAKNIWVGSPDYPSYLRFHRPTFDAWCPPSWIVGDFHETEKYVDIRRVDGNTCRIFFLSFDMPRTKWQGAGVDAIWLDEESPEDIFKECLARIVTTRGWILLTFTPVSGQGWWFDRIWTPAVEGLSKWAPFTMPLATKDPVNEDEFEVGTPLIPHLSREQIVEFASEYPDPDERSIRIFGEPKGRQGLVYKQYRKLVHNIPRFEIEPVFDLWGGLDPGYHGFAAVIGSIDPTNRLAIVQEYFSQQETTHERFVALAAKVRELRSDEDWRKIANPTVVFFVDTEDPQVVLELNMEAATAAEEDRMNGLVEIRLVFASLDQGLKARKAGFLRIQQLLQPRLDRLTPKWVERATPHVGEPQMYFVDDLHSEWQTEEGRMKESRVLWELTHYSWKAPPKNTTVQKDDGDENSAHGAHAMAALRYLVMARLGPPDEPKENKRAHLPQHVREIWEHMEELEHLQLEQSGLL